MERYGQYKDSGVAWIGEIPAGWEVVPIWTLEGVAAGATPKNDEENWGGDIPWIGPADYADDSHYVSAGSRFVTEKGLASCGTQLVPAGSVVVSNRAPIGRVAIAENELCTNQGCKCLVQHDSRICQEYLYWYLLVQSEPMNMLGRGTTFIELSAFDLAHFKVPFPSLEQQRAIAAWLDEKCAEVDGLVADVERSVELLEEYRRSVISEAVTKGLDPSAPMKDSGVEWIVEIPEHWDIERVKFLMSKLCVGVVINPSAYYDEEGTVPFLKGSDVREGHFDLSDVAMISEQSNRELSKTIIYTNDVVMVRVGYPGRSLVVPPELDGANVASMIEMRCVDEVDPFFMCRVFNSSISGAQVDLYTYGAAMKQINVSDLAEFVVPVPPLVEQRAIAAHLDEATAAIDALIADKRACTERLREYRKSIISEAVTGKFKVA